MKKVFALLCTVLLSVMLSSCSFGSSYKVSEKQWNEAFSSDALENAMVFSRKYGAAELSDSSMRYEFLALLADEYNYDIIDNYDSFEYNEETQAYEYLLSEDCGSFLISVYFKDGRVTKIKRYYDGEDVNGESADETGRPLRDSLYITYDD